jgi:diguanylate cyclase (GGDEF)-like protein/PAS domain S-box-containing protein
MTAARWTPGPAERLLGEGLQKKIVESIDDGIYFVDRDRRIRYWAGGAERISGFGANQVLGRRCFENRLNHVDENGRSLCIEGCPLSATMEDGRRRQELIYLRHRDGHRVPVRIRTSPVRDDTGTIVGATEVFSDEAPLPTGRVDVDELRRLAFDDQLTGLPNRTHAERVLASRLTNMERRSWGFGLLLADVDHFKDVNDQIGHLAGDEVLRIVARTLSHASRPGDFVARWGGDEFIVVVGSGDEDILRRIGHRMRALVARSRPCVETSSDSAEGAEGVESEGIEVSISIGAAAALPGDSIDTLFARADRALYASKDAGRDEVSFLGPDDEAVA